MRKFYIENKLGQRYDLQNKEKCILTNPSGLGVSFNITYTDVGTFFVQNSYKKSQQQPIGDLLFLGDTYKNYREFGNFMKSSSDYKLVYIVDNEEFLLDIDLQSIEKSEIKPNGTLECMMLLNAKSIYYKRINSTYILQAEAGGSRWDMRWDFSFTDETPATLDLINDGQVPASFSFILYGLAVNPSLSVYVDNVKTKEITFDITIDTNEKLLFSSNDNNLYVQKEDETGVITNILNSLNIENDNFFKLPVGTSKLVFQSNIPQVDFTLFKQYEVI